MDVPAGVETDLESDLLASHINIDAIKAKADTV